MDPRVQAHFCTHTRATAYLLIHVNLLTATLTYSSCLYCMLLWHTVCTLLWQLHALHAHMRGPWTRVFSGEKRWHTLHCTAPSCAVILQSHSPWRRHRRETSHMLNCSGCTYTSTCMNKHSRIRGCSMQSCTRCRTGTRNGGWIPVYQHA